jgi:hypothetical protein
LNIRRSDKFKDDYKELPADIQLLVNRKLHLLIESFGKGKAQPSLRVKRIKGTDNPVIWEMSITMGIRATFSIEGNMIVLRRLGGHE